MNVRVRTLLRSALSCARHLTTAARSFMPTTSAPELHTWSDGADGLHPPAASAPRSPWSPELEQLLSHANEAFRGMSPEEQQRAWREQAISFTWGQLASMRNGTTVTRAQVAELYDAREELLQSQRAQP